MRKREVRGLAFGGGETLRRKYLAQSCTRNDACIAQRSLSDVSGQHSACMFVVWVPCNQHACHVPPLTTGKPEVLAHIHNGELISMVKRNNELFQRGAQVESGWV